MIGGARIIWIDEFMKEIRSGIPADARKTLIPEQYVILRSLQFARTYWK